MLGGDRLQAVKVPLLVISALICGALTFPSLAGASNPSQVKASSASKSATSKKSKSHRTAKCTVKASRGRHHKVIKSCPKKKSKTGATNQNAAGPEPPLSLAASFMNTPSETALGVSAPVTESVPSVTGSAQPDSSEPVEPPAVETPPVEPPPVEKAATTTVLASSVDPSNVSQSVTYTAMLNTSAATGTVEFKDAGTAITGCIAQTLSAGTATCTITAGYATTSSHTITATYNGDSNYLTSTSSALTEAVNKAATTTTVFSETKTLLVGQSVTYDATVNSATATGTVEFRDNGTAIAGCSAVTPHGGGATCTVTSYTTAGAHAITAAYSGDSNYLASTSAAFTQTINQASTTTTLASSANPSTVGLTVTYTATVNPAAATGTIEFKDGGTTIIGCAKQTVAFGIATCSVTSYPAAGSHAITASYSGDSNYLTSTSPA